MVVTGICTVEGVFAVEYLNLKEYIIERGHTSLRKAVKEFLLKQEIVLEEQIENTYALFKENEVIATGSLDNRVIKCVAVDDDYKGMGISNKVISHLLNKAYQEGNDHLFVYTKPKNLNIFSDMGFYEIACVPSQVILLENKKNGIEDFVRSIPKFDRKESSIAAIVMNCNPFTLGHQYLIEKASRENNILYVFVVSEDKSEFPTNIRFRLVKEGTAHLPNVVVCQTKDYLISNATFPSYFIKENTEIAKVHAVLDIEIFKKYFVPALGIQKRYVGEEPLSPLTFQYNTMMKELLAKSGIEVVEIPRVEVEGEVVSASRVRKLLRESKLWELKSLVPETTYNFLTSDEGKKIIDDIRCN